jgi:hypothetical protein
MRVPLAVAVGLFALVALARWGGVAHPGRLFAAGIALLSGLILSFGLLAWWLSLKPGARPRGPRAGALGRRAPDPWDAGAAQRRAVPRRRLLG